MDKDNQEKTQEQEQDEPMKVDANQILQSTVEQLAEENIQGNLDELLTAVGNELGISEELKAAIDGETVAQASSQLYNEVSEDPEYQQAVADLEDALNEQLDKAEADGELTVGEVANMLDSEKVRSILNHIGDVLVNSVIPNKLLPAVMQVLELNGDAIGQLLQDKSGEVLVYIFNKYLAGWLDFSTDNKVVLPQTAFEALTLLAKAMGQDMWNAVYSSMLIAISTAAPLIDAGFNIVGAIMTIANQVGWLTSKGAAFAVDVQYIDGNKYVGSTIQGISLYFAVEPSLRYPAVVAMVTKTVPTPVKRVMNKLPSAVLGLINFIIRKIDEGQARSMIKTVVVEQGEQMLLSQLVRLFGADTTLSQLAATLAEAAYNWVHTMSQNVLQPAEPGEVESSKPTDPNVTIPSDKGLPNGVVGHMQMDDVDTPDNTPSVVAAVERFDPGALYYYNEEDAL